MAEIARRLGALLVASGLSVGVTTLAFAQIANDGESFDTGETGTAARQSGGFSSSGGPVGPGLTRLPLTTPEIMPYVSSNSGDGVEGKAGSSVDSKFESEAVGTGSEVWPYTTARVAAFGVPGPSTDPRQIPVTSAPYRFTGKLWMRFGASWFVCTASLIKKGVLVTAAHCVHNYGQGNAGFADEVRWYPGNWKTGSGGPWGYFLGREWRIPTPYFNGTDTCQAGAVGVVCNNDIATVVLYTRSWGHAGQALGGWYGYGWNGYSFFNSPAFGNNWIAAIHQLGYPGAFDNGIQMQRTTSFSKFIVGTGTNGNTLYNAQLGSAQTGGSSGGPWLVNFGTRPSVNPAEASLGAASNSNIIIGVTSWGYTLVGVNVQGASWFGQNAEYPGANYGGHGAGNIGFLVNATCTAYPTHC